jgi:hypothetical protein
MPSGVLKKCLLARPPYIDSCALCSVFVKRYLVLCEAACEVHRTLRVHRTRWVFDPAGRRPPARSIGPCGSTGPDGSSTPRAEGRLRGLRGPPDPAGPQDPMGLRLRGASHSKSRPCLEVQQKSTPVDPRACAAIRELYFPGQPENWGEFLFRERDSGGTPLLIDWS